MIITLIYIVHPLLVTVIDPTIDVVVTNTVIIITSAVAPLNNWQPSQSRIPNQSTAMFCLYKRCTGDRGSTVCPAEDQVIYSRPDSSAWQAVLPLSPVHLTHEASQFCVSVCGWQRSNVPFMVVADTQEQCDLQWPLSSKYNRHVAQNL